MQLKINTDPYLLHATLYKYSIYCPYNYYYTMSLTLSNDDEDEDCLVRLIRRFSNLENPLFWFRKIGTDPRITEYNILTMEKLTPPLIK